MFGNEHNLSVYEQILKIIGHIDLAIPEKALPVQTEQWSIPIQL